MINLVCGLFEIYAFPNLFGFLNLYFSYYFLGCCRFEFFKLFHQLLFYIFIFLLIILHADKSYYTFFYNY